MVMLVTLMTMTTNRWSIASAKAELSDVVRQARRAPQILENRGAPVAVVVAIDDYRRLAEQDERRASWRRFLELSAALRAEGGVQLELPPRTARPDPFKAPRRRG
jgi:prevent-host-death family protein